MGFPPGHYYSPVPSPEDTARAVAQRNADGPTHIPGIDLRLRAQWRELRALGHYVPADVRHDEEMFGRHDAAMLTAVLRRYRTRRVVEVGSGVSTAVMLDAGVRDVTCIEPDPSRLDALDVTPTRLFTQPVQDVPLGAFTGLRRNDLLFIDSTHVVKAGSDVCHLMFRVLPVLRPGVIVHFHDLFWGFEYKPEWFAQDIHWTEAYLLRAFLQHNRRFRLLVWGSLLVRANQRRANRLFPGLAGGGGSLYLRAHRY